MNVVEQAKELMYEQTKRNKAPAWILTQMAIEKGQELAKKYDVREDLVLTSLYLCHIVFDPIWKSDTQKNHPTLSKELALKYLNEWNVAEKDQEIILNSIEAHHNKVPATSKIAEVVKNAECFKFVTVKGSLVWLHELGLRNVPFEEAVSKVIAKMKRKKALLTLPDCIKEADQNCKEIVKLFEDCNYYDI